MAQAVVTGGAGFIGSHLVRALVKRGDVVKVIDDFSTGHPENFVDVLEDIELHEVSICDADALRSLFEGVDVCYHEAALASVERSVADPVTTNEVNVAGTLNVFVACREAGVQRVVYASSSSVYGDTQEMPLHEGMPLQPISPYATTKAVNELYAKNFCDLYGMELVGLRYFNIFGPGQDPNSPYAAAIPSFLSKMLNGEGPVVYGTGRQSRDFTYVDNVVEANIKAAHHNGPLSGVFNIACGRTLSLLEMIESLNRTINTTFEPEFAPPRPGDVQTSLADITSARDAFGYVPVVNVEEGLQRTVGWYEKNIT
ncbi:MAG: SDR family oxidoreductase [Candidatus Hydrogenedentota bacterium]